MPVVIHLDKLLKERKMTAKELANAIDITEANLSILKSGKAKAIRFTTLESICEVLDCQPGDIIKYAKT
jgi:putative transcriptional regulator